MSQIRDAASSGDFVRSFARGLSVICAFGADHPKLSLSEVADRTSLTRAAARRFLITLEELGYVRADGREFSLTPKVLDLGYAYLSSLSLRDVALPHLHSASQALGESVSLSVLDGSDIVYVARVATHRIMSVAISVGTRFPAWATSMGRVLLAGFGSDELRQRLESVSFQRYTPRTISDVSALVAELSAVRTKGFALVDEELEAGLRSVAVPIRDPDDNVVAAMNVSMHAARVPREAVFDQYLPGLLLARDGLEADYHRLCRDLPAGSDSLVK